MLRILAKIISYVINPVILNIPLVFFLVFEQTNNQLEAFKWMLITAFYVFIIGVFLVIEVKEKAFTDLDVSNRKQRPRLFIFLFIIAILYLATLFLLKAPSILIISTVGVIFYLILLSIINMKVKASIHVAYITACCTGLFILFGGYNILWFLIVPIVAWARLYLKRHTPQEVIVGSILGIVIPILVYYISIII